MKNLLLQYFELNEHIILTKNGKNPKYNTSNYKEYVTFINEKQHELKEITKLILKNIYK